VVAALFGRACALACPHTAFPSVPAPERWIDGNANARQLEQAPLGRQAAAGRLPGIFLLLSLRSRTPAQFHAGGTGGRGDHLAAGRHLTAFLFVVASRCWCS
jgi:hypothetical protein